MRLIVGTAAPYPGANVQFVAVDVVGRQLRRCGVEVGRADAAAATAAADDVNAIRYGQTGTGIVGGVQEHR